MLNGDWLALLPWPALRTLCVVLLAAGLASLFVNCNALIANRWCKAFR